MTFQLLGREKSRVAEELFSARTSNQSIEITFEKTLICLLLFLKGPPDCFRTRSSCSRQEMCLWSLETQEGQSLWQQGQVRKRMLLCLLPCCWYKVGDIQLLFIFVIPHIVARRILVNLFHTMFKKPTAY